LPGGNGRGVHSEKSDSWYCQFIYRREIYTLSICKVDEVKARATKGKVEYVLMRLKQNLLNLPPGCDIATFLQHDGKPPGVLPVAVREPTLGELQEMYFRSQEGKDGREGKLEQTTLDGIRLHFKHLTRILGAKCHIPALAGGRSPEVRRYSLGGMD
jgi:hypothetical protein